jgi:hypothetical protein
MVHVRGGGPGSNWAGDQDREADVRPAQLRRGEPMPSQDLETEWASHVKSAEHLASTALRTAEAWANDAEVHQRIAVLLADFFPEQAQKHRDRAAASELLAVQQRDIAAAQLFRARRLSAEASRRVAGWRRS